MGICIKHDFASATKHCPDCKATRYPSTLREVAENLNEDLYRMEREYRIRTLESFARKMRNEVLEEVAQAAERVVGLTHTASVAQFLRSYKDTDALRASVPKENEK